MAFKKNKTENGDAKLPLGLLTLQGYERPNGPYFIFVYLQKKTGAKTTLQMVHILVNNSQEFYVTDDVTDRLLGDLMKAEEPQAEAVFAQEDVRSAEAVADEYITMLREKEERSLRRSNEVLINNRIESIRQTLGLKEQSIHQTIQQVRQGSGNAQILRMHEGRLRHLHETADAKIAKWESSRR